MMIKRVETQDYRITEVVLQETNLRDRIDTDSGVVRGVKVLGERSKNGFIYMKSARERAIPMYEGIRVNIDHSPTDDPLKPRKFADRFGVLRNITESGTGLVGDLHYNTKHGQASSFAWFAKNQPGSVGLSHNAFGRVRTKHGTNMVEQLMKVHSVDLVSDPATNRSLFEQIDPTKEEETMSLETVTVTQLQEQRGDLVDAILRGHQDDEASKKLKGENKQLLEELNGLKARDKVASQREKAVILCQEAKLSKEAVSDNFMVQLAEAKDESAMKILIEDRVSLCSRDGKPKSSDQTFMESIGLGEGEKMDRKKLVGAVFTN